MRSILTIEDDPAIRRGIVDALRYAGYRVFEEGRGDRGVELAERNDYDLLLLDLVLPGMDGLQILRRVREVRPTTPVIILSAKGEESNRVEGLKQGADDYVVKPFSVNELLARVEAVLRRSPARPLDLEMVNIPGGEVDLTRREVRFHGDREQVELSERECQLLRYLAQHPGRPIDREELLANVWRIDPQGVSTRTIDMHVARLREKLRDVSQRVLATVRGKGYVFQTLQEPL